ncbi:MAG TPA: formate dehydrogenase subunit delta [Burkholderiaceae bacterium]
MDIDNLIKMANRIGDFYESLPDPEEASREISGHLKKFWAPRMRIQILDYVEKQDGAGLSPIVLASIRANLEKLRPDPSYQAG